MAWAVDTCLLIDVLDDDPEFGRHSAVLLDKYLSETLVVCPISYVELAPAFLGDCARQNEFLESIGIEYSAPWAWHDTQNAHRAWARYTALRRECRIGRRPVADILIGAFASSRHGLLTRNVKDFQPFFPSLTICAPDRRK